MMANAFNPTQHSGYWGRPISDFKASPAIQWVWYICMCVYTYICMHVCMYVWYGYILYIHIYHNEETIFGGKSVNIITLNIKLCIYIKWGIIIVILFLILKHEVQCLFLDSSSVLWTYSVLSSWWQWETVITLSVSSFLSFDLKNRDRSTYFMRVSVEEDD